MRLRHLFLLSVILIASPFLLAVNAAAYMDPSAMTYLIQIVAGVVIATGAALTIYWKKIRLWLKKRNKAKQAMNRHADHTGEKG